MTKVTLENIDGKFTIEREVDDMTVYDLAQLFRGLLQAAGYDAENVAEILPAQ